MLTLFRSSRMDKGKTLNRTLNELGLSDNQSSIYLALLGLDAASVAEIARAAGVKRTTIYPALEKLIELGLVRTEIRGFKKQFAAENPQKLELLAAQRLQKIRSSIGEFNSLYAFKKQESLIKHYRGIESVKSVYRGLLDKVEPNEDYLVVSNQQQWHSLDPEFFEDFLSKRAKLNPKIRCLLLDSPLARQHLEKQKQYNMQVKILPANLTFTANMVLVPSRFMIHHLLKPTWAIEIDNREIVKTQKQLFEVIWQTLPQRLIIPNTYK